VTLATMTGISSRAGSLKLDNNALTSNPDYEEDDDLSSLVHTGPHRSRSRSGATTRARSQASRRAMGHFSLGREHDDERLCAEQAEPVLDRRGVARATTPMPTSLGWHVHVRVRRGEPPAQCHRGRHHGGV